MTKSFWIHDLASRAYAPRSVGLQIFIEFPCLDDPIIVGVHLFKFLTSNPQNVATIVAIELLVILCSIQQRDGPVTIVILQHIRCQRVGTIEVLLC